MTKNKVVLLILVTAILACALAMPLKTLGRNLFYFSAVVTIVYAVLNIKRIHFKKEDVILALFLFLMGFSQWLWVHRFPASELEVYMADSSYGRSGVYLMIGSVVMLFVSAVLRLHSSCNGKFINYALLFGFSYLTLYALHYHFFVSAERLRIDGSSTLSAYLYAFYSMITLYALACVDIKYRKQIILLVVVFSLYIIFLTQTRSVLIFYPLILLFSLWKSNVMSKSKMLLSIFVSLLMLISAVEFAFPSLKERMVQGVTEVSQYTSDNNTSMGARISMWRTGAYEIYSHPMGVSSHDRYKILSRLMQEKEQGNPEGLRNIVYHLHNDLIETMSLQGVLSGIILLGLYAAMIFYVYKKQVVLCAIPMLCAPIILFGSVDSLFIHDRFIVMFITSLIICAGLSEVKKAKE